MDIFRVSFIGHRVVDEYRQVEEELDEVIELLHRKLPTNTLYGWMRAQRLGRLDLGAGTQTPQTAMSLADEVNILRQQVKNLTKENRRLKEENEFLEEASAFFAASRRKSAKAAE